MIQNAKDGNVEQYRAHRCGSHQVNHVTTAGIEENPSSEDTKRSLNLQKWVKHTLSTWGTRRTYPEGHNSPDTNEEGCKLFVDWASIALSL